MDFNKNVYLYKEKPVAIQHMLRWETNLHKDINVSNLFPLDLEGIEWENSLVERHARV